MMKTPKKRKMKNRIQNDGQEEEKNKLKDAFDHCKNIKELRDILLDRAKEKKALDHWKNNKELRDIMDGLKKNEIFQ